jgi:geranyl-CoA carboxylase alpha subunit
MSKTSRRPLITPDAATTSAQPPATRLIRKMLVANRGEIACRVMRTCRALGIATVAVFSDADATARHVRKADEAIRIGPSAATASYLNIPALVAAARRTDADAIHPGYGFLAENADFAAACRAAGLTFIGPEPLVIAQMGSKRDARRLVAAAGVPVVPGYDDQDQSDGAFLAAARRIGYPVLVKPSAGGGGKGMHIVTSANLLPEALAAARREALAAFGDGTLLLEKLISEPRHVEFQIFGDAYRHIIHLGERECSIQRRHQKIVEETPSTALTSEVRARMGEAAVTVGKLLAYTNAGTVEFLVDPAGTFYFLEMNTRLQVEHPVTELLTGLDLVQWQIRVAEGHPLPLRQDEVRFSGHAVEARLYAEEPAAGFLPATGTVALWRPPDGEGVRVDGGIETGDVVSPYYDPLLAKLVAHGGDRNEALRRLDYALEQTTLFGVRTNRDFLRRVLLHPVHRAGTFSTAFVETYAADLLAHDKSKSGALTSLETAALVAALVAALARRDALPEMRRWRNNPSRPLIERYVSPATTGASDAQSEVEVRLTPLDCNRYAATLVSHASETTFRVQLHEHAGPDLVLELDGHLVRTIAVEAPDAIWWVKVSDATFALRPLSSFPEPQPWHATPVLAGHESASAGSTQAAVYLDGAVLAPMPGQIVAVLVAEGESVRTGDPLLVLAAMKMEHTVRAPRDGVVAGIRVARGDQAAAATVLLELHPSSAS